MVVWQFIFCDHSSSKTYCRQAITHLKSRYVIFQAIICNNGLSLCSALEFSLLQVDNTRLHHSLPLPYFPIRLKKRYMPPLVVFEFHYQSEICSLHQDCLEENVLAPQQTKNYFPHCRLLLGLDLNYEKKFPSPHPPATQSLLLTTKRLDPKRGYQVDVFVSHSFSAGLKQCTTAAISTR